MKKCEIIDFALSRCCSRDEEKTVMTRPFEVPGTDWVCASDSKICLFVSKALGVGEYESNGDGKAPNVKPFLDEIIGCASRNKYLDLQSLLKCQPEAVYEISGTHYRGEHLLQTAEALSALGCSHMELLDSKSGRLYFRAADGQVVGMMTFTSISGDWSPVDITPDETADTTIDFKRGEAFIAALDQAQTQKEIRLKKGSRCFSILFARYSRVCVEAETFEEAITLAEKYKYNIDDFDESNPELLFHEDNADPKDFTQVITRKGVVSVDDFLEDE